MSALNEYIEELRIKIEEKKSLKGSISDVEIIRFIYIDLGKKMNFDLGYTFGNSKQKKEIYGRPMNEEQINKAYESRTIICKSLAYIVQKIMEEFGYKCTIITEPDEYGRIRSGAHVYNRVTTPSDKTFTLDLEEDLEFIQSGSKTRYFGLTDHNTRNTVFSETDLRRIDTDIVEYIPEGMYLEDMLWMLDRALDSNSKPNERFKMLLDNLNKYRDISQMGYRDRILYYQGMIDHFFGRQNPYGKESYLQEKIEMFNCYRTIGGKRKYVSCIITDFRERQIYLFNDEKNCYECINQDQLVEEMNNGLEVPNEGGAKKLKRYGKQKSKSSSNEDRA
ncbi:MAG: hypothetical protein IJH12_08595 [Clostridia bacterium]|nr:hypothetical protein [Clostridia bacterium]